MRRLTKTRKLLAAARRSRCNSLAGRKHHQNNLYDIYHTDLAERYRTGSRACRNCRLNPVCRGCLAIAYSMGLDVFTDKDPFCFASHQVTGE